MTNIQGATDLARFRAAVLADTALQSSLQEFDDLEAFLPRAQALAGGLGLHLDAEGLLGALRDDPLGLARWSDGPPSDAIPQTGWLPVNVLPAHGQLCVDWAFFGERPLAEPFFEDSARRALRRPLNRLARHRTRLIDLPKAIAPRATLQPSGFIFHMSRCGSTLVSQMLAADPRNVVVSEAAPIDTVVRVNTGTGDQAQSLHAVLLAAMIAAIGQRRGAGQERLFVKLDSWHTLALPLFRRTFPDVPWVFLYREPGAVLASQMIERGIQTVPEYMPPALFGLSPDDALDSDAYCAQVLGRTCEAVLQPFAQGGGRLVNYRELPDAVFASILPHFGVDPDAAGRAAMVDAGTRDAKAPALTYAGSGEAKEKILTPQLRAMAERHIGETYRQLEALRQAR